MKTKLYARPNILILFWGKFPFGSASASRLRNVSKGLLENGVAVRIITTSRIPLRAEDCIGDGVFEWNGIRYESTNVYDVTGKKYGTFSRIVNHLLAVVRSWLKAKQIFSQEECNAVYIYGRSILSYTPIAIMARYFGLPIFYEINEWFPSDRYRGRFLNPAFLDDFLGRQLARFSADGVVAITSFIKKQYDRINVPCILIPSVYDTSQTQSNPPKDDRTNQNKVFVLTYAGSCKPGDGFGRLVDAVRKVVSAGYSIRLDVVGTDGRSGWAAKHRRNCEKDDLLCERVHFLGRLSEEGYSRALRNASCLVLPRPSTQIARAAFPTRLPEFLATGRPVLTTNVPDVPLYLDAGVHAEIVDGNDEEELAQGIIRLIKDPDRADKIGSSGQQRCLEMFDYRSNIKRLSEFLNACIIRNCDVGCDIK